MSCDAETLFFFALQIFPIFGASNPALGSVPLIVIIFITAVKDAIEDYRRTVLDNELNNTGIHLLVGFENPNVTDENISHWRLFKKATSRFIRQAMHEYEKQVKKAKGQEIDDSLDLQRSQTRASVYTVASESYQMTPVPSPTPDKQRFSFTADEHDAEGRPKATHLTVPQKGGDQPQTKVYGRDFGNVVDPHKEVTGKASFKRDYWKNVRVGDFVRIYNDEEIPADVIILSTSDADGACYVETKNLDGETNLKVRQAVRAGRKIRHARDCEAATFLLESEHAHANLYSYSGVIKWQQKDPQDPNKAPIDMSEAVSINNLLLRGCMLRNTDWCIGIVAFTGDETKIMMNAGITPSKRSRIQRELNWNVSQWSFFVFVICSLLIEHAGHHEFHHPAYHVPFVRNHPGCYLGQRE